MNTYEYNDKVDELGINQDVLSEQLDGSEPKSQDTEDYNSQFSNVI